MSSARGSIKPALRVWALWLSILVSLALPTLWVTSYFIGRSENCLAVGNNFFASVRDGWIELASQVDSNSGYPQPGRVNTRMIILPKGAVMRSGNVDIPGFELHFCTWAGGGVIWSLRVSFLIPVVLSGLCTVLLFHFPLRRKSPVAVLRQDAC